jgi:putative ABC transport system permease protein
MINDIRLAARALVRQPSFSVLALVIMALGLGATTAMFSLVNALLLRPVPYPEPDRLVRVSATVGPQKSPFFLSPARFREYRSQTTTLEGMAAFVMGGTSLAEPDQSPEVLWYLAVTQDYFSIVRGQPALGRMFVPEEDQPERNHVVILSSNLWLSRFGGDKGVIGRRLRIGGEIVTVVGVMPPEFSDPLRWWGRVDFWRPLGLPLTDAHSRENKGLNSIARLKPGVTAARTEAELQTIASNLDDDHKTQSGVKVSPLGLGGAVNETGERVAWLTMGLALFVLVCACFNLAGVQLARLATRSQSYAIRVALGAGRGRLIREMLAESMLLSVVGGGLGLLVAQWCTRLLAPRMVFGSARVGVGIPVELDPRVLLFALALVAVTGLLVGTVPAWLSSQRAVADGLRRGARGSTDRAHPRLRQGLVIAQMAFALVLLAGGGLFLRGLQRFLGSDPGWKVDGLLTGRITLTGTRYSQREARSLFLERLQERLGSLAGVERSVIAGWLPIVQSPGFRQPFVLEGTPPPAPGLEPIRYSNAVSLDYFGALGIRLLRGRLFDAGDGANSLRVIVINEAMAQHFWPGQSPLGKRIGRPKENASSDVSWLTIVGVVSDLKFAANLEEPITLFHTYIPLRQSAAEYFTLALRTRGNPEALISELRRAVADVDPELPVYEPLTARALANRALANISMTAWILFGFALLGLILAALGVYGLFSGYVAQRTREIGVRVALGAQPSQVLALVMGKGLRLAIVGASLGMAGALALVPVFRAVAFELPAAEPTAMAALALTLVGAAMFACWLPARRAAAMDPMVAFRQDW